MKYFALLSILLLFSCQSEIEKEVEVSKFSNAEYGAVVSAHPEASKVGMDILRSGGNAFDAAIATFISLAVVYPRAGNISGGGFMVYYTAEGEKGSLDFREKAPSSAFRDMYLDSLGNPDITLCRFGGTSVAVPGSLAGMSAIHSKLATLPWDSLIYPSIAQAKNGVVLTDFEANTINRYYDVLLQYNGDDFYLIRNGVPEGGDKVYPKKLAKTLELIAENGSSAFYSGVIAEDLISSIKSDNGSMSLEDLANYKVVWRDPISMNLDEYDILCMGPPSSGGIALAQLLYGFDKMNGDHFAYNSSQFLHLNTELQRRVYADRAEYLGDPDFVDNKISFLLDSNYLNKRFSTIDPLAASKSSDIKEGDVKLIESVETTHISIIDKWGNAVSITTTLNGNFGSKLATKEGGFLLNNQMDDFSVKPGFPNQFGLVGNEKNAIEANKRMLSSMTPTIVLKNGSPVLIVGTPGGSTIITSVYQSILANLVYGYDAQSSINLPKFHSQWLPDVLYYEKGRVDSSLIDSMIDLGHFLESKDRLGKMKVILALDGNIDAAGDTLRGDDKALVD